MPNPLFNMLMGGGTGASQAGVSPNLFAMAQQLKANPVGFLLQHKLNIPQSIANDPNAILQYLVKTGQVNPSRVGGGQARNIQNGRTK